MLSFPSTLWPTIAVPGQDVLTTPGTLVLVAAVVVISVFLYLEDPPITRRTILSLVPWMIAASALPILAVIADYPPSVRPLIESSGAYLSTYLILGIAWFAMMELSVRQQSREILSDYLGSMGIGLATILITLVVLQGEPASIDQLGWSLLILFGTAIFAVAVVFVLGFWYVDAPTYTGAVGMLAVFGQTLDAVARSAGIGVFEIGSHSVLSWQMVNLVATVQPTASQADQFISWSMTYIWIKIAFGVLTVIFIAQYSKEHPQRGYLLLGIVAALGITAGMTNLLMIAIGGLP
mgnify:CR=1 FL=1